MDYEKKYNKAIESMRKMLGPWRELAYNGKSFLQDLESIFPELRESKDERIRRTLVEYFGRYNPKDKWDDEFSFEDVLSFLEKQKEPTPADGWDYADKRMSHPLYLEGFEAGRAVEREASEPAAEWSEEDEKMIWDIVDVLEADNVENKKKFPYALSLHERYKKMVDWLKSLRPQPKQEWGEEDEKILEHISNVIDANYAGADWQRMIDWLNNLRPKPHWKPSEEQMTAFAKSLMSVVAFTENRKILESLYEQLKKL